MARLLTQQKELFTNGNCVNESIPALLDLHAAFRGLQSTRSQQGISPGKIVVGKIWFPLLVQHIIAEMHMHNACIIIHRLWVQQEIRGSRK